ncbi:MAG: Uncharacterised protein [Halieaceae bacterium]|nr:MAG: Uncharacterised protein [Halieaceae bacterium]
MSIIVVVGFEMVHVECNNGNRQLHSLHARQLIIDNNVHTPTVPEPSELVDSCLLGKLTPGILQLEITGFKAIGQRGKVFAHCRAL